MGKGRSGGVGRVLSTFSCGSTPMKLVAVIWLPRLMMATQPADITNAFTVKFENASNLNSISHNDDLTAESHARLIIIVQTKGEVYVIRAC